MSITDKLRASPINYFSDLFVAAMVIAWAGAVVLMAAAAVYSTVALGEVGIWSDFGVLVAAPVTAGGAIWMIKNSVQHAIANGRGERANMDFPSVDALDTIEGIERPLAVGDSDTEEKETEE